MKKSFHSSKLRPIEDGDLSMVLAWRNSDWVRLSSHQQNIISEDEHKAWATRLKIDSSKKCFIFEYDNKPAGLVQFFDIDSSTGTCEWGFYLSGDQFPRGTGALMGSLALDLAFNELKLNTVNAEVLISNPRSSTYHEKLGFDVVDKKDKELKFYTLSKSKWMEKRRLSA